MTTIGHLRSSTYEGQQYLHGRLITRELDLEFWLEPARALSPGSPDYRALGMGDAGCTIVLGPVWQRTIKRGEHAGEPMLSLMLDVPNMDAPVHLVAFPDALEEEWRVLRRERQARRISRRVRRQDRQGSGA